MAAVRPIGGEASGGCGGDQGPREIAKNFRGVCACFFPLPFVTPLLIVYSTCLAYSYIML